MAITYDSNARQMSGQYAVQEAARLLHEVRPSDIISFDTVLSPYSFDREVRVVFRVPYERDEQREQTRRLMDLVNMRVAPGIRVSPPSEGAVPLEDEDEDDERLRRLGVR